MEEILQTVFRSEYWAAERSRKINKHVIVTGTLVLETPAHFGNGEDDGITDMTLMVDSADGRTPILTGTSLAGALARHLTNIEHGYGEEAILGDFREKLFGDLKNSTPNDDSIKRQSVLILDESYGYDFDSERRDGIRIDPRTKFVIDEAKFDFETWSAGTKFPLRFELLICEDDDEEKLKSSLLSALSGLQDDLGGITLGARKKRGFGRISVEDWKTREYDLTASSGLFDWLLSEDTESSTDVECKEGLGALGEPLKIDKRHYFDVQATLRLKDSLLVGSEGFGDDPDSVHLHARRKDGSLEPILPGTSIAGVFRHQASAIVRTRLLENQKERTTESEQATNRFIDDIFGTMDNAQPQGSRILVQEYAIKGTNTDLIQNRTSIDYFTGNARDGHLFNEQPVWETSDSSVRINWRLQNPKDEEIGLLLFALKDACTSGVEFGGEGGIGRGRLQATEVRLSYRCPAQSTETNEYKQEWQMIENKISSGEVAQLEEYAMAFGNRIKNLNSLDSQNCTKEDTP